MHSTPSKRSGLSGFERRPIDTLSVGQFQRVLFARLLLQTPISSCWTSRLPPSIPRPSPTSWCVIQRWRAEQRTVVAVLHDLDQVRRDFPNALLLARELVDAGPTARVLSAENLLRARAMAEAWDEHADACDVPMRLSA